MNTVQNQKGETLNDQVDRISTLPDDIICGSILSLIPTKDSVRTSALSTRWKHLYASVPSLDFESSQPNFLDDVVKVLNIVKEKQSRISKLRIHLEHLCLNLPTLMPLIDYLTSHSIQQLDLFIIIDIRMATPHSLFTCETLVSLSLANLKLSVPDTVCLSKLKELRLEKISLSDDESVRRLFSSCPVLESLLVHMVTLRFSKVFNVSVPSLKVLSLCLFDTGDELVINCPNLEELTYESDGMSEYYLNIVGVLKKCNIKINNISKRVKEGKLIELVRQVSKVQSLSLAQDSMRALLTPPSSLPTFENLTHMELQSIHCGGLRLLPSLLDSSPRLESLVFAHASFFDVGIPYKIRHFFRSQKGETLNEQVDRISTLPDDIICGSILSLIPTKDSVRTSALSTRWKHLYASVPSLDFESSQPNFLDDVVKVLNIVKEKQSRISKLRIHLEHVCLNLPTLIPLIDYFTSHSIQQLDLFTIIDIRMATPHSLFTCETLVSLSLANLKLSVPDTVCLSKLKELRLEKISLSDDESVRRLFSSCPVLESLLVHMVSLRFCKVFNVSVPSLKVLSLCLFDTGDELVINCPNLEELTYEGDGMSEYYLNVVGVLKKCNIKINNISKRVKEGKLIELVRQVSKVQSLSLAQDSMRALLTPPSSLPTFENLTHMELQSIHCGGLRLLPSLLDSSPRLESLVFAHASFFDGFINQLPLPEHRPVCLSFHLRMIRIGNFHWLEEEYKWVEYFLTNALVLEKLEIGLWWSKGSYLDEMSKRLLNFQRSSQICQIILA